MSAKEMFEKLGFECDANANEILYYQEGEIGITFNLNRKEINIIDLDYMNMQEFKAIQQQIKELGWND